MRSRLPALPPRRTLLIAAEACALLGLLLAFVLAHRNSAMIDFRGGLWNAGRAILNGRDPYQAAFLAHQVQVMHAGGAAIGTTEQTAFSVPLYPAPANLAVLPLSLLPFWLAGAIYTVLSVGALLLGLRLLGVRDGRCLLLALGSWPFLYGVLLGSIGPWLVLGVAVAWRYRARVWPPALATAAVVVAKLFPWPLAVWLLITRRFRALLVAVVVGGLVTLAAWAVVGLHTILAYPRMLANASLLQEARSASPMAILTAAGVPVGVADAIGLGLAAVLLGLAWRLVGRPDGDRRAFALAIIAGLASSPIVWTHYMVLLLVPIALLSPRLSPLWFIPLLSPALQALANVLVPASPNSTLPAAVLWVLIELVLVVKVCRPGLRLPGFGFSVPRLAPRGGATP